MVYRPGKRFRFQLDHFCGLYWVGARQRLKMSLACLVCHSVESPSHSFRSYSVSSSDNEGRCSSMASCLSAKLVPPPRGNSSIMSSSKVTPQPTTPTNLEIPGTPRLVRSHAVRRDQVRDWNFDEVELEQ